ncbi:hypothetical protein GF326_04815 [Candidatus Bathyarchaeota archaeon]|nr:hypothetical protein [Candidatus Bathyarchaeota archaeon]
MTGSKPIKRDEIMGVLTLVLLFISVVGGREIGNYYAGYQEMTELKILFEVSEEELSRYILDLIEGGDPTLEIGLIIASPNADNAADIVTSPPDYVNRWLIGLTVSPVVVNQPEASDMELNMYLEDNLVEKEHYNFDKQKISYISYTKRSFKLDIEDLEEFRRLVEESSKAHGGEVKVMFQGRVHVHLLFLDTWLPYTVTRYPLVSSPRPDYVDSVWRSYTEESISSLKINEAGYVLVEFRNPMRLHSLVENVTCSILKDDKIEMNITKNVKIPPDSTGQYIFSFSLTKPGNYTYRLISNARVLAEGDEHLSVIP